MKSNSGKFFVTAFLIVALISVFLIFGCSSDSDSTSGSDAQYSFAALHHDNGNIIQALKNYPVKITDITQDTSAVHHALILDGNQITPESLKTNETVKAYIKSEKGILLLNATKEHKAALKDHIGISIGKTTSTGLFTVKTPNTYGREHTIIDFPDLYEFKLSDFSSQGTDQPDEIDEDEFNKYQSEVKEKFLSTTGPQSFVKSIIAKLEENKKKLAAKEDDPIPSEAKYMRWKYDHTVHWSLKTSWWRGYPDTQVVFPAPSPMNGEQSGSYGHTTFIAVYLDNAPSNAGDDFQWLTVDHQAWANPDTGDKGVSMPMKGDEYEVIDVSNYKFMGYGWGQMSYIFSFAPLQSGNLNNYQVKPENQVEDTEYESGTSIEVGYSKHGVDASFGVDNTVSTSIPSWVVETSHDEPDTIYYWNWHSKDPDWKDNKIKDFNTLNQSSFDPNSSCVMITKEVLDKTLDYTITYGVTWLATSGYWGEGVGSDKYHRNNYALLVLPKEISVDYGAVLYPSLQLLSISPSSVPGGTSTTGTVTLDQNAPEGGVLVNLTSSNSDWASVPSTVTIPEGKAAQTFTINTYAVTGNSVATITAELNKVETTATLTVEASTAKK